MIRALRSADIPVIAAWIPAVPLWRHYAVTTAHLEAQLEEALNRGELLLVADIESDGSANGLAWCLPGGMFGRSAYLRLLGVQNGYSSRGAGATLLHEVERRISEAQQDLFLLVSDFNTDAQRFYRRQGYQQAGSIPGYVLPDVTELLFWKSLSKS